jgi:hypothetical protein
MLTPTTREILTFNHPFCLREYCQPATSGRDRRRTDRATSIPLCRRVSIQICLTVHSNGAVRSRWSLSMLRASGTQCRAAATSHTANMLCQSQTRPVAARTASENGNAFRQIAAMLR